MPEYATATAGASGITPVVAGLVSLVVWIVSMYFARKIAGRKGRSPWLGLILGFVLSWIGLIIVALLPSKGPRVAQATGGFRENAPQPPWATQSTPPPLPPAAPVPETPQAAPPAPEAGLPVSQAASSVSTASEPAPPAPPTLRLVRTPPPDVGPPGPRSPEV